MAWNAAWHAANMRSQNAEDAEEDRKLFEKHAAALAPWRLRSWCKTPPRPDPPFRGVNLGGLLLCERWMQHQLFSPYPAAADEFRLAQEAGPETFAQHRDTWITKRELQEMKADPKRKKKVTEAVQKDTEEAQLDAFMNRDF